jgi:hypothetical protein
MPGGASAAPAPLARPGYVSDVTRRLSANGARPTATPGCHKDVEIYWQVYPLVCIIAKPINDFEGWACLGCNLCRCGRRAADD